MYAYCCLILGNRLRMVRQNRFALCQSTQIALWDTTRIRFGKFASLFAFVLFAGGCVVRIGYESFSDFGFSEFFLFLEW